MVKTISTNRKPFQFYLWLGAAYLMLWVFSDLLHERETFWSRVVNNIWLTGYLTFFNFILFEFTLPFIRLSWKRILIAPLLLFAHLMFYSVGLYGWRFAGIQWHIYTQIRVHPSIEEGITYHFPYSVLSVVLFGIIKHIYELRQLRLAAQQLRIEKQQAELNYLKSQTNPHFLFNTLNNIYALARDKSDLAAESILHLSKILRYMLYETGGAYIAIEQEIKIIRDYIALEQLRYDESLLVHFNHDVEDMKQALPPLLLMPLVENAFKHGVSETRSRPFVDIHLSVNKRQLIFVVKNSSERTAGSGVKENIGLSNLRRQLELQYSAYELNVKQEDNVFAARLTINLASHV